MNTDNETLHAPTPSSMMPAGRHDSELFRVYALILDGITDHVLSARELENTAVKPVRRQLMQTGKLRDIRSETRDGSAIIRLKFDYGTNTDLAFIEVNEKIDAAMNNLPRDFRAPALSKPAPPIFPSSTSILR